MRQLADIALADPNAERVRASHAAALRELQAAVVARARVVTVQLADGVATNVAHGLGRAPIFVSPSIVRLATTTGRIVEDRSTGVDRTRLLVLTANGWGSTVEVDLLVF
jgi:hypothetical protein